MFRVKQRCRKAGAFACLCLTGMVLQISWCTQVKAQWSNVGDAGGITTGSGSYNNLVIDNNGNYYVSYYDVGVGKGSVQKYDGTSWSYPGGQGITATYATYNSLAAGNNYVYYGFQDAGNSSKASVKRYSAGAWTNIGTAFSSGTINFNSTKVAHNGYPVMIYRDGNLSGKVGAKKYDGTTWADLGTQGFFSGAVYSLCLAAGSNDTMYAAGVTINNVAEIYKIHISAGNTTAWQLAGTNSFSATSSGQFRSSLAIDGSDRLYFAYVSTSVNGNKANVKKYENGVWSTVGTENFSTGTAEYISIAVTGDGTPYVAYTDASDNSKVNVMKFNGSGWDQIGSGSLASGTTTYNSLAIDTDNKPVLAFTDAGLGGKMVVFKYNSGVTGGVTDITVTTANSAAPEITTDDGTLQMTAAVLPATANQNVEWDIVPVTGTATITDAGLITAQRNGTVWARAVSVADGTLADSVLITLSNQYDPYEGLDGVIAKSTLWLKANSTATGKLGIAGNTIASWTSELSSYTITAPSAAQQPDYITQPDVNTDFNFNPSLKFGFDTKKVLKLESASTDLLGNKGTLFVVVNTWGGANTSSTCLAYKGATEDARYQVKAHLRIQTGGYNSNGSLSGYTSDFDNTGFNYPDASGRLLVSRATGANFYTLRNGVKTGITINNDANYIPAVNLGLCVGSNSNLGGTEYSNTAIAEVMLFNDSLPAADINTVQSYLAVKYGITLDPAVNSSYVSSAQQTIWDGAANAGYHYCITAVGRDDALRLLQKQSHSVEQQGFVYLYNGSTSGSFTTMNTANNNGFTADASYVFIGDNGADTAITNCYSAGKLPRMARAWKMQKSGVADSVTIAFDDAATAAYVTRLIVSDQEDFSGGNTQVYTLQTGNGKRYYTIAAKSDLYFTFAGDSVHATVQESEVICYGTSTGSVTTAVQQGVAPFSYTLNTTAAAAQNNNLAAGDYILTVTDAGGCSTDYAVTVTENDKNSIVTSATHPELCTGDTATLSVTAASASLATYLWTPGNAATAAVTVTVTAGTTYYVTGNDANGCAYKDSVSITVKQPIQLVPVVTLASQQNGTALFTWEVVSGASGYVVSADGGVTYTTPSSGTNGTSHTVTGIQPGQTIQLIVRAIGDLDCESSSWSNPVSALYMVNDLFVPNAFTPNGDGKNDKLLVFGSALKAMELAVFNQWGQSIFRTTRLNDGWDGTFNGRPQPSGVYMYVLKATLADGSQTTRKGSISLVR